MTDFVAYEPGSRGGEPLDAVIRGARAEDEDGVARLISLRNLDLAEARSQAPAMIASLPVLLIARLASGRAGAERAEGAEGAVPPGGSDGETGPAERVGAAVGLSGALVLPADRDHRLSPGWMVSGLVVDPGVRRRGLGRRLLAAVVDAVGRADPGSRLHSVVNARNRASLDLHMAVGFREVARADTFAGIVFTGGHGVLLAVDTSPRLRIDPPPSP